MLTLLISCGDSQSNTAEQQTKEAIFPDSLAYVTKEYKRIFPECEGDDCTSYTLGYIELTDAEYLFINDSIKVQLIGNYASMDAAADNFFDKYEEAAVESEWNMPWSEDLTASVDFNRKGLFTVSYAYYAYYGGAHGMPGFSSVNYDLATKKELTLYDLVNAKDSTALKTLGEKYFRIDQEIAPNTSLSDSDYFWDDGKFYFSDVFTITNDGLIFTFSPYEIAPYAAGMPGFTIPYADLKPYFTENSPLKRLGL